MVEGYREHAIDSVFHSEQHRKLCMQIIRSQTLFGPLCSTGLVDKFILHLHFGLVSAMLCMFQLVSISGLYCNAGLLRERLTCHLRRKQYRQARIGTNRCFWTACQSRAAHLEPMLQMKPWSTPCNCIIVTHLRQAAYSTCGQLNPGLQHLQMMHRLQSCQLCWKLGSCQVIAL